MGYPNGVPDFQTQLILKRKKHVTLNECQVQREGSSMRSSLAPPDRK